MLARVSYVGPESLKVRTERQLHIIIFDSNMSHLQETAHDEANKLLENSALLNAEGQVHPPGEWPEEIHQRIKDAAHTRLREDTNLQIVMQDRNESLSEGEVTLRDLIIEALSYQNVLADSTCETDRVWDFEY